VEQEHNKTPVKPPKMNITWRINLKFHLQMY
jgi:hypothetical protein